MDLEGSSGRCSCSFTVSGETCWHDVLGCGHLEPNTRKNGFAGSCAVKPGMAVGGGGVSALSPSTSLAVATLVSPGQTALDDPHCGSRTNLTSHNLLSGSSSQHPPLDPNPGGCSSLFEHGSPSSQFVVVSSPRVPFPQWCYLATKCWCEVLMSAPFLDNPTAPGWFTGRRNEENPQTKVASYPGQEDEWISQVPSNVEFHNWIIACDCIVILGICKGLVPGAPWVSKSMDSSPYITTSYSWPPISTGSTSTDRGPTALLWTLAIFPTVQRK